jgi:hypothetical protein
MGDGSKYKRQVYYGMGRYAFSFRDVEQIKKGNFGGFVNLIRCKKVV